LIPLASAFSLFFFCAGCAAHYFRHRGTLFSACICPFHRTHTSHIAIIISLFHVSRLDNSPFCSRVRHSWCGCYAHAHCTHARFWTLTAFVLRAASCSRTLATLWPDIIFARALPCLRIISSLPFYPERISQVAPLRGASNVRNNTDFPFSTSRGFSFRTPPPTTYLISFRRRVFSISRRIGCSPLRVFRVCATTVSSNASLPRTAFYSTAASRACLDFRCAPVVVSIVFVPRPGTDVLDTGSCAISGSAGRMPQPPLSPLYAAFTLYTAHSPLRYGRVHSTLCSVTLPGLRARTPRTAAGIFTSAFILRCLEHLRAYWRCAPGHFSSTDFSVFLTVFAFRWMRFSVFALDRCQRAGFSRAGLHLLTNLRPAFGLPTGTWFTALQDLLRFAARVAVTNTDALRYWISLTEHAGLRCGAWTFIYASITASLLLLLIFRMHRRMYVCVSFRTSVNRHIFQDFARYINFMVFFCHYGFTGCIRLWTRTAGATFLVGHRVLSLVLHRSLLHFITSHLFCCRFATSVCVWYRTPTLSRTAAQLASWAHGALVPTTSFPVRRSALPFFLSLCVSSVFTFLLAPFHVPGFSRFVLPYAVGFFALPLHAFHSDRFCAVARSFSPSFRSRLREQFSTRAIIHVRCDRFSHVSLVDLVLLPAAHLPLLPRSFLPFRVPFVSTAFCRCSDAVFVLGQNTSCPQGCFLHLCAGILCCFISPPVSLRISSLKSIVRFVTRAFHLSSAVFSTPNTATFLPRARFRKTQLSPDFALLGLKRHTRTPPHPPAAFLDHISARSSVFLLPRTPKHSAADCDTAHYQHDFIVGLRSFRVYTCLLPRRHFERSAVLHKCRCDFSVALTAFPFACAMEPAHCRSLQTLHTAFTDAFHRFVCIYRLSAFSRAHCLLLAAVNGRFLHRFLAADVALHLSSCAVRFRSAVLAPTCLRCTPATLLDYAFLNTRRNGFLRVVALLCISIRAYSRCALGSADLFPAMFSSFLLTARFLPLFSALGFRSWTACATPVGFAAPFTYNTTLLTPCTRFTYPGSIFFRSKHRTACLS